MFTEADLIERVRNRARYVKNPSRRMPERETIFHNPDNVERQLQEDGHKIWAWVIYRCTYGNDEEWAEFMRRLTYYIENTLRDNNALDMLPSADYHVFEDRDQFDSAHPSAVIEHFTQWAATAPQQEQGEGAYPMRSQLMVHWYHQFRPQGSWGNGNEYRIPPEVARIYTRYSCTLRSRDMSPSAFMFAAHCDWSSRVLCYFTIDICVSEVISTDIRPIGISTLS